jgi:2-haloacid dehalogenase
MAFKLVTFDVYMALIDIQGGLTPVVSEVLSLSAEDAAPIVGLWRTKQMERAAVSNSLGGERTSFRDCTRMGLDYVLEKIGRAVTSDVRDQLVLAWDAIYPWPEACAVVTEVKRRGYQTAILSNGDQGMLDALARAFGDDMDFVLSSESAGAYKPHPAVYELPMRMLNVNTDEVLHVAGSGNDVLGARAFGMSCYWSNRSADRVLDPRYAPDHEGDDLRGVLDFLPAL